jgi:hypothetical protein
MAIDGVSRTHFGQNGRTLWDGRDHATIWTLHWAPGAPLVFVKSRAIRREVMLRKVGLLAVVAVVALSMGSVSAQGIPSGAFVKDSQGNVWLVINGQRSQVPLHPANDDQISAFPTTGQWVSPTGDGQSVMLGGPPPWAPQPTPTSDQNQPPTVEVLLSDDRIDPGQKIDVTVKAQDDRGLNRVEMEGTIIKGNDDNDNRATGDAVLDDSYKQDCDGTTTCEKSWTISPTTPGRFVIRARARDTDNSRSEWAKVELRIREGAAPKPTTGPTAGPTAAPTAVQPAAR